MVRADSPAPATPAAWIANSILALLVFTGIYATYLLAPFAYVSLIAEDNWAENATAVFTWGSLALLWAAREPHGGWRNTGTILLMLCLFFIGMEEISWGQRVFDIPVPDWLAARNFQGELNFHNLSEENTQGYLNELGYLLLLWGLLSATVVRRLDWLGQLAGRFGLPVSSPVHVPVYFVAALFMCYGPLPYSDEIAEALFTLSFYVYSVGRYLAVRRDAPARWATVAANGVVVASLTVLLTVYYNSPGAVQSRSLKLAGKYADRGFCTQAAQLYDRSLAMPGTDVADVLIPYHTVLVAMGQADAAGALLREQLPALQATADARHAILLGDIAQRIALPQPANHYYAEAVALYRQQLQQGFDAEVVRAMARVLVRMGETGEARRVLEEGLATTTQAQQRKHMRRALAALDEPQDGSDDDSMKKATTGWQQYALKPRGLCLPPQTP